MELENILNQFGLKKKINCREPNFNFWSDTEYEKYPDQGYLNSDLRETDEVYSMSQFNLLHIETGIRFKVMYSESYYGDELDYTILQVFVKLKNGKKVIVDKLDLKTQTITSSRKILELNLVSKEV